MLGEKVDNLSNRYSTLNMFLGGILRGMGIIVGATLMVLIGSLILNVLGLLPGFEEIVKIIFDASEKARLAN